MSKNQKIVSYFKYDFPGSGIDIQNRFSIAIINDSDIDKSIDVSSPVFKGMASTDLGNLLIPFATSGENNYYYPKFDRIPDKTNPSGIHAIDIMPFRIYAEGSGFYSPIKNIKKSHSKYPYAESQKGFLAGSKPYSPDLVRHDYLVRGIAQRTPYIVAGWGYDLSDNPLPSGGIVGKFKGDKDKGYEVDPKDYIAAPLELRYDVNRGVWRSKRDMFLGKVISSSGNYYHTIEEQTCLSSGMTKKANGKRFELVREINNAAKVPSGTIVVVNEEFNDAKENKYSFILPQARQTFIAKITGQVNGGYTWVEQNPDGVDIPNGKYSALPLVSGSLRQAYAISGPNNPFITIFPSGTKVLMHQENDYFYFDKVNYFFPVLVEYTSGANGSLTTKAQFVYTVRSLDGQELGTNVPVVKPRPKGFMEYNNGYGSAFYNISGIIQLWDAGETPALSGCTL